jgi:hypothetical protein
MAFTAADWTIDRQTGNIRYTGTDHGVGTPSYATVIELHRALQDYADDASSSGDDELDITDVNPTDRSTDNIITLNAPYNIDATAAEHLYDGSIIFDGGDEIYDGIVNYGNVAAIQIIQNGAVLADDWWNSGGGLNATTGISHRFMLLTRTGGADIDGRRLIGTSRTFGKTYSEFSISGTSRGNNVLALSYADDLNNQTASATVGGWTGITNTNQGYVGIDVNGNGANEYYYSKWDKNIYTINQLYERLKYLSRDGSSSTLYGLNGELFRGITHEITTDTPSATDFSAYEAVSWSGGTGQMLAVNDVNNATKMWIQLLTGVAPTNNQTITGGTSGATCLVDTTVTTRTISTPFAGVSTGSAIIGAYGLGIEAADLSASDKVFDLTNTQITPPNNVTFTVSGLVSGDRVLVTNDDTGLDYNQMALNGALSGASVTSVVVSTTIPADTPSTGTIRIERADGTYTRHPYSAWATSTFTITSHNFSTNNAPNGGDVFISYIDAAAGGATMSFTTVYSSDRTLFVRVRDGGATPIKPFETVGTLGSSGGSATAIRTSDS